MDDPLRELLSSDKVTQLSRVPIIVQDNLLLETVKFRKGSEFCCSVRFQSPHASCQTSQISSTFFSC